MTEEKLFKRAIRSYINMNNILESENNIFINLISLIRFIKYKMDMNKKMVMKYKFQIKNILKSYNNLLNQSRGHDQYLGDYYQVQYKCLLDVIN